MSMERVRNIFRDFSTQIIVGIVVSIVITSGVGVWAWFRQLAGFHIALIVIGVLCVSMVLINQFDAFFQRRKKPLYQQPHHYIDSTLRDWLYKGGFSLRANNQEGFDFLFVARDKQERPILIGKPNNKDEIMMEVLLGLKPIETEKLEKLDPELQRKLLSELRISLAMQQVAYSGLKTPITNIVFSNILVLDDSFTRDMFLARVDRVRYSLVSVLELLNPILERKIETETLPRMKMDG